MMIHRAYLLLLSELNQKKAIHTIGRIELTITTQKNKTSSSYIPKNKTYRKAAIHNIILLR